MLARRQDHPRHLAWQSLQGDIGTKAENNREYQTCGPRPVPGRALAPSMSTARPVPARASSVRCSSRRSSCSSRGKPLSSAAATMAARLPLPCGALRRRRCKSSPLTRRHQNRDPEQRRRAPWPNRWQRGRAGRVRVVVLRLDLLP